jgi:hypothetical protein
MKVIERGGTIRYRYGDNGFVHRDECPAILWDSGSSVWYYQGKIHRDDGPGGISPAGGTWECKNGQVVTPGWITELFGRTNKEA